MLHQTTHLLPGRYIRRHFCSRDATSDDTSAPGTLHQTTLLLPGRYIRRHFCSRDATSDDTSAPGTLHQTTLLLPGRYIRRHFCSRDATSDDTSAPGTLHQTTSQAAGLRVVRGAAHAIVTIHPVTGRYALALVGNLRHRHGSQYLTLAEIRQDKHKPFR